MKTSLLFLLLFAYPLIPQTVKIDSLLQLAYGTEDKRRIDLLLEAGKLATETDQRSAVKLLEEALDMSRINGYRKGEAEALHSLGLVAMKRGEFEKNISLQYKALDIATPAGLSEIEFLAMNSIAITYGRMEQPDEAIKIFERLIAMLEKRDDGENLLVTMINTGALWGRKGDIARSEEYLRRAYRLAGNKYPFFRASAANNLSFILMTSGRPDEGFTMAAEAEKVARELGRTELMLEAITNKANILHGKGENEKAITMTLDGIVISRKYGLIIQEMNFTGNLYLYNKALGRYEEALEYYEKYSEINDSVLGAGTQQKIVEMQTLLDSERKDSQLRIQEEEIIFRDRVVAITLAGGGILTILLFVTWGFYRKKKEAYDDLVSINLEITRKEKEGGHTVFYNLPISDRITEEPAHPDTRYSSSSLTDETRVVLLGKLRTAIDTNKIYREKDTSLDKLAAMLDVNTKYLSQLIHEVYGTNFPNFINGLRIRDARMMLSDRAFDHLSIEGVGETAGFNSKQAFFTAFKKATGITPAYFRAGTASKDAAAV